MAVLYWAVLSSLLDTGDHREIILGAAPVN